MADENRMESFRRALRIASTQYVYEALIACKNEWNERQFRGETTHTQFGTSSQLKKVYLHFEQPSDPCACGDSKKPGTHAEFACTISKSVPK